MYADVSRGTINQSGRAYVAHDTPIVYILTGLDWWLWKLIEVRAVCCINWHWKFWGWIWTSRKLIYSCRLQIEGQLIVPINSISDFINKLWADYIFLILCNIALQLYNYKKCHVCHLLPLAKVGHKMHEEKILAKMHAFSI